MSEPICIWLRCTNRVQLYSREYGIRVCNRECLALYIQYKQNSHGEGNDDRFRDLWFLHISLLQQLFYEKYHYGEGVTLEKLKEELVYNNKQISSMLLGGEQNLLDGLNRYTRKTIKLFSHIVRGDPITKEEDEWKMGMTNLLGVLELSGEVKLMEAMNDYSENLLELMKSIVENSHHCIFRLLITSVSNLSNLIRESVARVAPQEVPTMMLRPENGRSQSKK